MSKIIAERYELLELIGQGGMADVYLAKDIILNRTIAIKILRTSLAKDPIYVTRFQREASAAAALSHRNIVEIYDVGEDEDKYYISKTEMEEKLYCYGIYPWNNFKRVDFKAWCCACCRSNRYYETGS